MDYDKVVEIEIDKEFEIQIGGNLRVVVVD